MQSELVIHLDQLLERLRQEKDLLDQVISDLERLHAGRKRPRGRPPGRSTGESGTDRTHRAGAVNEIG